MFWPDILWKLSLNTSLFPHWVLLLNTSRVIHVTKPERLPCENIFMWYTAFFSHFLCLNSHWNALCLDIKSLTAHIYRRVITRMLGLYIFMVITSEEITKLGWKIFSFHYCPLTVHKWPVQKGEYALEVIINNWWSDLKAASEKSIVMT